MNSLELAVVIDDLDAGARADEVLDDWRREGGEHRVQRLAAGAASHMGVESVLVERVGNSRPMELFVVE